MEDYIKNLMAIGNEGMLTKKVGEEPVMTLFIKSIIRILQISKSEIGDIDSYVCIAFLNTMLEQFPGKLDGVFVVFVKILVTELSNKDISKSYRLHVLLLVAHMFIYNPHLTLKVYTDTNVLIPVCQNFFSSLKRYTEVEQFRGLIYGITSLIKVETESMPDVIKSGMTKIIESLIILMHKYTKEREREKIEQIEEQLASKPEETEEIKAKRENLAKLQEVAASEKDDDDDDDDDDLGDDDDYLWSRSDSYYYKSKLEELEAPLYFRDVLQTMKEERPETYEALTAVISEEQKVLLENIIQR